MKQTTDNANNNSTELSASWINETGTTGGSSDRVNPMKDFTLLKVYNPKIGDLPDIELDGFILAMTEDGWIPFTKELKNVKVLEITKCYKGYANKLENGKPIKDEHGQLIKELYYTPEVSVYDRGNIALAKSTDKGPVVLGKGDFDKYLNFTTSTTLADNTLNPLFDTLGTNQTTGEKYPISIMRQEFYMYFEMEGELYKIRLGGSYGRWKDPKDGTVLAAKDKGIAEFKKTYPTLRFEFYYLTLNATIEKADKYKYLHWNFEGITQTNVLDKVTKTKESLTELNKSNFPGISIDNGMEALPYDMGRLALSGPSKSQDIIADAEITIELEDVPF